ncbi:SDR family oxidoreductase [Aidingimonas halophila]|uniref:2-keto-3-deoxy-L-fuconate dehydrogenase n=1 Tax=Aidingimonas halophila TaxID=574349 RepID=A0A1H3GU88_9GAMM|nr:SDR family oxidoreductase [Aidingimonas halophila]GHC35847.1 oxidoreductase [Aidingimonas halophila]SDY05899.1 2-keto-3-deoxy-L-fuconate dehydrogenase [Aidingimonas halophila]
MTDSNDQVTRPGRVAGKTILVTGAGQGIGRAVVEQLAAEGGRVIATSRTLAPVDALAEQFARVESHQLDVADDQAIAALAARIGPIDVLANVAGYVHDGTILDTEPDDWERSFDINARAVYATCRAFLPGMLERGSGNILNIASVAGPLKGVPRRFAYSATKAAVVGMTRSLAMDFIRDGIRANVICPGTVESPSLVDRMHATGDAQAAREAFINRQPMGRLGRPEEIAALAVHLSSDESAYTTGAVYAVDGGAML